MYPIKPATQQDLEKIVDIYNQAILTKTATAELTPVSTADKQAWFDEHQQGTQTGIYVIKDTTQTDEPVIAWSSISNLYPRVAYHISCEISIYIDKPFHGQGIGKQLVQWTLQEAQRLQRHNAFVKIFAHNQASLSLFQGFGFNECGYLSAVCDMDGFIADVVMLNKVLLER